MRAPDFSRTQIGPEIELMAPGKHVGHFAMLWSDNANPLGAQLIPAMSIIGAEGPTVLLMAGVHGDEYEGPVALMRLFQSLDPAEITGRLIFLPQANAPAVRAATRCSPLDGGNLNRAFPGDARGGPTAQIANLIFTALMPVSDAVIDLHSGGKASWFTPCTLAARAEDGALDPANMALAAAFGAPITWVLPGGTGNGSVNNGAAALGVPCIATELGGAGVVGREALAVGETGLTRALAHLGILATAPEPRPAPRPAPRRVDLGRPGYRPLAPTSGLWEPVAAPGEDIAAGDLLGLLWNPERPEATPQEIRAGLSGLVLAETRRGPVFPGDFLAFIATEAQ